MTISMISIQTIVKQYLSDNVLVKELLSKNLLNISQLADNIQPWAETQLEKDIARNTLVVAINRYRKSLDPNEYIQAKKISGVYPVYWHYLKFKKYPDLINFLSEVTISKDDLCVFKNNKLIVVAKTREKNIRNRDWGEELVDRRYIDNLCEIKIEFPDKYLSKSGFLYKVSTLLSWKGYAVVDIHVIENKIYIYSNETDFSGILEVLRQEFDKS